MATLLSQEWVHWSIGLRVSRHAQKQRKRRKWLGFSFGQRKNEGSRVGARVLVHWSVVVYKRSPTALKIKNNNVRNFSRDSQSMMWPCVISVFLRSSSDPPGNIPFSQMQILVPILFIWWLGPHWVDQNAITSQYILSDCQSFIPPRTLTIVADLRRCGDLFVRLILSTPSITSMKERCFLMWHRVARQHLTSCTQQTHRSTKGKQDWILNQNRFYNVV